MIHKKHHTGKDGVDYPPNNSIFRNLDAILFFIGVATYLSDVGLDGYTAYRHWYHGDFLWSYMTMAFMIVPSIILSILSLWWYKEDLKCVEGKKTVSKLRWTIRIIFLVLQLSPVLRYIDCVILGIKSRRQGKLGNREEQENLYMEMLNEESDCCFLRLFESFLEAVSQLILQLYILCLVRSYEYSSNMIYVLWLSCLSSLLNVAWGVTAYSRGSRYTYMDRTNISWTGSFVLLLWQCGIIGSRVAAFVVFSLVFGRWVFLVIAIHWLLMNVWLLWRSFSYTDTLEPYGVFLFALMAMVYVSSLINDKNGRTRGTYALYYLICVVENVIMLTLCYYFSDPNAWYLKSGIIIHVALFIMGLFFMAIYYTILHPNFSIPEKKASADEAPINDSPSPDRRSLEVVIL